MIRNGSTCTVFDDLLDMLVLDLFLFSLLDPVLRPEDCACVCTPCCVSVSTLDDLLRDPLLSDNFNDLFHCAQLNGAALHGLSMSALADRIDNVYLRVLQSQR